MVDKGEKVTLWCLDSTPRPRESQKRMHDEHAVEDSQPKSKKKCAEQSTSSVKDRRSQAKENEERLKELHTDKWTPFQYKLRADMLVCGTHKSFEEPPMYASMFSRDQKHSRTPGPASDATTVVINGMVTAMNTRETYHDCTT